MSSNGSNATARSVAEITGGLGLSALAVRMIDRQRMTTAMISAISSPRARAANGARAGNAWDFGFIVFSG